MSKVKIQFFAADPLSLPSGGGWPRLRLDDDIRGIREKIRMSDFRDALEVDLRPAARPDDLLQALYEVRPHVVHFSAHGWSEGLLLMDPSGRQPHRVHGEALAALFRTFPGNIRLVVLNACDSDSLARVIAGVVGCAIGMRGKVSDEAAITFGSALYRAIGFGESIQAAFDQARVAVELSHFEDRECPQLAVSPGGNAGRLVLVPRGGADAGARETAAPPGTGDAGTHGRSPAPPPAPRVSGWTLGRAAKTVAALALAGTAVTTSTRVSDLTVRSRGAQRTDSVPAASSRTRVDTLPAPASTPAAAPAGELAGRRSSEGDRQPVVAMQPRDAQPVDAVLDLAGESEVRGRPAAEVPFATIQGKVPDQTLPPAYPP